MRNAFAKAQESLDDFLRLAATPRPGTSSYSLKVAIVDGGAVEYLWVTSFERSGDRFSGLLNDEPAVVKKVRRGQRVTFDRRQIVDWQYVEGSPPRVHGQFTTCAQLADAAPEDVEEFERQSGLKCE